MTNTPSHLLVLEPDPRGHTCEWIGHLLAATAATPSAPALTLVVASNLAAMLSDTVARVRTDRIRILPLTPREQELCTHRRLAVSGFARWWVMRRYLERTGASHGLFLEFDHLSLPLGLGLRTGRKVSGILFRPSVHYRMFGSARPSAKERLRDWRKAVLYRLMLMNPALDSVLSLDPYFPDFAQRHYRNGTKVTALPDPAFPVPGQPTADDLRFIPAIPKTRNVFVLFGELTERKGVLPLLDALAMLSADIAERTAVIIAGRVDPDIRPAVHRAMDRLDSTNPRVRLHLEDRRLSERELVALVDRSDVVLAPYQRFVGSSGILIWAARMQRPVICQDYGLLGHLVRLYALGLTTDATNPTALSEAISEAVRSGPATLADPAWMAGFIGPRTPERFASTILGRVSTGAGRTAVPARTPNGHKRTRHGHTPFAKKFSSIGFLLRR